jgi:choline transport protein
MAISSSGSVLSLCSWCSPSLCPCEYTGWTTWKLCTDVPCRMPTSGGQYHWVFMLAPRNSKKLLSYVSGWLTLLGWLASFGSGAFLTGGLIQGLLMLCQPDTYIPKNWHVTLLYWAVIAFCVFINVAAGWLLPKFEGALLVLHILGFFAILIPLLVLGPQGNAKEIFTTFVNLGGWKSQGLSFCIGIMGSVFAFVGKLECYLFVGRWLTTFLRR